MFWIVVDEASGGDGREKRTVGIPDDSKGTYQIVVQLKHNFEEVCLS